MKKIFSMMIAVLLCAGTVNACMKKREPMVSGQALTVIVMDTTQALLDGAEVKIGKQVFKTSYDGRVVLDSVQLANARSLTIACEGYKQQTIQRAEGNVLVVQLLSNGKKRSSDDVIAYGVHRTGTKGLMYRTLGATEVKASAVMDADFAVEEMAVTTAAKGRPYELFEPAANDVSAGKLTAGEVNDFAKWSLWDQYRQSTIQYQKKWGIAPRHRYTVQVVNKNGYPVVNYPVSLTDVNGNTVFQAVTDNTGKAELWNGLIGQEAQVNQPEWQTIVVEDPCDHTDKVDVCFVFDATGSMGDELQYLQAEMKDVVARAKEATGGLEIRTGAVVYRDHGDDYITRISRLTDKIGTTQAFIDKQEANGGGDYPEAVPEALMAALNSAGWDADARARIAFLILDAPCHEDSATLALLHDQILNAAAMGVRLVPVVCSGIEDSAELLLRAMALATNGTSFFLTDDSGIGNTHHKPTTDTLKVEHLNDMLVRTIVEFSYMPNCAGHWEGIAVQEDEGTFVPNPFDAKDLTQEEKEQKDSRTTLYLIDISGKLLYVYEGNLEDAGDSQLSRLPIPMLSTGIYFVKAFYDGEWHTKKILVH